MCAAGFRPSRRISVSDGDDRRPVKLPRAAVYGKLDEELLSGLLPDQRVAFHPRLEPGETGGRRMKTLRVNDYDMAFVERGAGAPLLPCRRGRSIFSVIPGEAMSPSSSRNIFPMPFAPWCYRSPGACWERDSRQVCRRRRNR
jgi:hypothetical protein